MKLQKMLLVVFVVLFMLLSVCPIALATEPVNAEELFSTIYKNQSKIFKVVSDLSEIPSPVCVVISENKECSFLQSDELPIAPPESARCLLRASISGDEEKGFSCDLLLASPSGDVSVKIGSPIEFEKRDAFASALKAMFAFTDADFTLFDNILAYETALFAKDYLTPVNACKDDYDKVQGLSGVTAEQVCEPFVYLKDADYVCDSPSGKANAIVFPPAEKEQFVPPVGDTYARPEISGPVSLGFSTLGKKPDDNGKTSFTMAEVQERLKKENTSFCFAEIIGVEPFGTFTSKSTGQSFVGHSYQMRLSVISLDGKLLGWTDLTYRAPQDDPLGLSGQFLAMTLSMDKNGTAVFQWGYKSEFWEQF